MSPDEEPDITEINTKDIMSTETLEAPAEEQTSPVATEDASDESGEKSRDFTKVNAKQIELTEYINAHSGLDAITPNQAKAAFALRTDFNNTPEQKEARAKRKAELEAEKKQYEGLSEEQIKAHKQAKRLDASNDKLRARLAEAEAKAEALRNGTAATGEDLAAVVETAQAAPGSSTPITEESAPDEPVEAPKRRIGRNR